VKFFLNVLYADGKPISYCYATSRIIIVRIFDKRQQNV